MENLDSTVRIVFGTGQIQRVVAELSAMGLKKDEGVLLLSGKTGFKQSGYRDLLIELLKEQQVVICDQVKSYPEVADLFEIKETIDALSFSVIIAVGGGSVIDVAKGLVAFYNKRFKSVEELGKAIEATKISTKRMVPSILAIPTVAGSGSEITRWATFWDRKLKRKYSIEHEVLYPKIALIDPLLTLSLPQQQAAISALDSLCHATEAYWSKKTTKEVRQYALKAIKLIRTNLHPLLLDLQNIALRSKLFEANVYAALAFSKTKTTACHAISYPLTNYFGIDHGIAVSLTLPALMEHNQNEIVNKKQLFDAFEIENPEQLKLYLHSIYALIGKGKSLKDYNVDPDSLQFIADRSFSSDRMDNNPIPVSKIEVYQILKSIF